MTPAAGKCAAALHGAYIGTSGWSYGTWRAGFYADTPAKDWLRFCAARFTGIEVNATFYRLQRYQTFERWREQVPAAFRFAIKGHRYLTHTKKLADPVSSIRLERERALGLGEKLAAVVWQLPGNYRKNVRRLAAFARALHHWPEARHALEFRHRSWFDDEVLALLAEHGLAICISDAADWPRWDAVSTDMVYLRLHGHTRTYASAYSARSLARWASRIRAWLDGGFLVHAYFDNDAEGAAPRDALRLLNRVERSVARDDPPAS